MGREVVWPLFGLRLETPSLTLRCATEDDVCVLAAMLPPDIETDPSLPRHERLPHDEQRVIGELQQYWRNVGSWTAASWKLPFVVAAEGALIGIQTLEADGLHDAPPRGYGVVARRRGARSRPWPGDARRGARARLRRARAHFAVSSAWHDNHASLGVSRSLGYVDNGIDVHVRDDRVDRLQRMILSAERWRAVTRPNVTVVGLDECLSLFGLV